MSHAPASTDDDGADDNEEQLGGEIVFGGTNPARYDADTLAWAPVIRKAYWEVELQNATLGGEPLDLGTGRTGAAIDTGIS